MTTKGKKLTLDIRGHRQTGQKIQNHAHKVISKKGTRRGSRR